MFMPEGINPFDKISLFSIKIFYLGSRTIPRLVLGRERRNKLLANKRLSYEDLLVQYFQYRKKGKNNSELPKFRNPKYGFEFYCRNGEEFKMMLFHEWDVLEHFIPMEKDVVVDVGAHIGSYTIVSSKKVGQFGKVVAIEADPNNFDMLNQNIQLNKLTNVVSLNCAAYSKEDRLKLFLPTSGKTADSEFTKYNTIMSQRAQGKQNFVEVSANTLDTLLKQNGINQENVNWIKIDVEGAELEVLKGSVETISRSKGIRLLIEIHNLSEGKNLYEEIMVFLKGFGFNTEFEKKYENGEKHVIMRKI